MLIFLVIQQ